MTQKGTVAALFELAITAEKAAAHFYEGLSRVFRSEPAVAACWKGLMADELSHAEQLAGILAALPQADRSAESDAGIYERAAENLRRFSLLLNVRYIHHLEDAYDIAYELEYSEVNQIFQGLLTDYAQRPVDPDFALNLIRDHAGRLEGLLRTSGGPERMRSIVPDFGSISPEGPEV
jgi:hypothetical protein